MTENDPPTNPNDPADDWVGATDDWAAQPDDIAPGDDTAPGDDHEDPIDPPPYVAPPPPVRRLRRTSASSGPGVAGGIARHLGVEAGLIKAAFIIASFVGGLGIFAYVAAWALIPDDAHPDQRPVVLNGGVAAIVVGTLALAAAASSVFNPSALGGALLGPAILIAIGFYILDQRSVPRAVVGFQDTSGSNPSPTAGTRPSWIPPLTTTPTAAPPPPASGQQPAWGAIHTEPVAVVEATPRPPVTAVTLAAVAVVTGVLLVVDQYFGVDVTAVQYFGAGLGLIVAGLVVSLFIGRAIGLWFAGLIALFGVVVSPIAVSFTANGIGSETNTVISGSDLEPTYSLGTGVLTLDLRDLDLRESAETALDIEAGEIVLYLPEDDDITIDLIAEADFTVFWRRGMGLDETFDLVQVLEADFGEVTVVSPTGSTIDRETNRRNSSAGARVTQRFEGREGAPVLTVRADARFGSIEVRR